MGARTAGVVRICGESGDDFATSVGGVVVFIIGGIAAADSLAITVFGSGAKGEEIGGVDPVTGCLSVSLSCAGRDCVETAVSGEEAESGIGTDSDEEASSAGGEEQFIRNKEVITRTKSSRYFFM